MTELKKQKNFGTLQKSVVLPITNSQTPLGSLPIGNWAQLTCGPPNWPMGIPTFHTPHLPLYGWLPACASCGQQE